jgi:hypothetical protein
MSFSPDLHCGHTPHGRRTVETTRSPALAKDQELVALGRLPVQAVIDLGIGAAQPDAQHLHGNLVRLHLRIRHVAHVDAVAFPWPDDDGFHGTLRFT